MKNEEIKIKGRISGLLVCILFFLFFIHTKSVPAAENKTKSLTINDSQSKTVVASFKISFSVSGIANEISWASPENFRNAKSFSIVKIPTPVVSKKRRLIKFRHHLQPENEPDQLA